ncbi:MAG: hypothetical protein AB8V23_03435 [Candidatus Midichloria sp.]|nr:hypothetical protein MHYMCMPSP_00788 [Hyalomma marginatum]
MFNNVCKTSVPVSAETNLAYSSFVNEEFTSKIIQNWNLQGEVDIKVKEDILKFYFLDLDKMYKGNFTESDRL